ncbi:MAG TPA: BMP family ABC transporter substrate-binding protein [Acetobacteraceae bacterium]|nr:BMP family ABC transporter substrate-binding protein [Acetobacteraceae bacterium]
MQTKRSLFSAVLSAAFGLALTVTAGAAQAAPKRVVLLVSGTLGDKSFFDSANHGMQLIKKKYGDKVQTRVIEAGYDQSKWQPTLEDLAAQNWDMIIVGTYQMPDILSQVAADHPDRRFVIFDSSMDYAKGQNKNVYSITYKQNEASYLAGLMAEGMVKSGAIPAANGKALGFLGGMDIPVINDFLTGYVAGAQSVDPGAKVAVSYIGSFSDAAKGKELALVQYRSGVGIGFNVAGQAGLGQLAAAKDMDRLAIGVDSDQEAIFRKTDPATADKVVTSVLKRIDNSLVRAFGLLEEGKLPVGHTESLGLKEGAVGIVKNAVYEKRVPAAVRKQVDEAEAAIAAGRITVPTAFGMTTAQLGELRDKVRP